MPLPSRPVNRDPEQPSGDNPRLADTPDVAPLADDTFSNPETEEQELPLLAETEYEEQVPTVSYDDIVVEDAPVTLADAEEIAQMLEDTPVEETTFVLPAPAASRIPAPAEPTVALPTAPPAPVFATAPAPAPQPVVAAPSIAVSPPVSAEPVEEAVQTTAPEANRRRKAAELTEEQKTQQLINSLPRELKESIGLLFEHITDEKSSEVILNGPNLVGFKQNGQRFFDERIDFGDTDTYHQIINHFLLPLTNTKDRIGKVEYLIEGQLRVPDEKNPNRPPLIARIHIVAPPAVEVAKITIAKKSRNQFTVDTLVESGSMSKEMGEFMKAIARGRATIIFSGLSGSGKTTLLEAISRDFDVNDRIVLVEDTAELSLPVSDVVELTSTQAKPGEALGNVVTLDWLVRQANRMRPDRIIVGEVRGAEMAEFLTAANSGADGSMTTVHASSPQQTINKVVSLAMKNESSKSEMSILRDVASSVQIIVQMTLIDGKHIVSQIEEVSNTVLQNGNGIATNPLYVYDRNTNEFHAEGRVSDEFRAFLSQRGVTLPKPAQFNRNTF